MHVWLNLEPSPVCDFSDTMQCIFKSKSPQKWPFKLQAFDSQNKWVPCMIPQNKLWAHVLRHPNIDIRSQKPQTLVYLDSAPKLTVSHHQPPAIFFFTWRFRARSGHQDKRAAALLEATRAIVYTYAIMTWSAGALFLAAGYGILPGIVQLFGVLCFS